jgi:TPR repeat protein
MYTPRTVQAVLAGVLALSLGCSSYYLRRADSAFAAGDYDSARELYHHVATEGLNGYARFQLAKIHEEGLGADADLSEALRWYRASGDLGNRFAQYKAGLLLEQGHGDGPDDLAVAANYYRSSAHQGEGLAALRLGEMTLAGTGVEQHAAQARALFQGAAVLGNSQAAFRLGQMLLGGDGGEADPKNGIGWLLVAAHEGHALAQTALARAIRDGDGIVARSLAQEWFKEAAERGNSAAQHELSNLMAEQGLSDRGHEWRMASANAGYVPAQIAVAELCQQTQPDDSCAAYWYNEAAKRGNAYSLYQLGHMAETGRGSLRDLDAARRWYALAADRDMIAAKQRLHALGGI